MKKEESLESIVKDYMTYCSLCEILERDYSKGAVDLEYYTALSNALEDYQQSRFGDYMHSFDSAEEFERAYLDVFDDSTKDFAKGQVRHELQHGAVGEKYGFKVDYGFFLFKNEDFMVARPFCYIAFPEDITEELLRKFRKECAEAVDNPSSYDLAFSDPE